MHSISTTKRLDIMPNAILRGRVASLKPVDAPISVVDVSVSGLAGRSVVV